MTSKWYRMDSSGMLYPMIGTLSNQSNYRLSFRLDQAVEESLLTQALERAYKRFPYYNVTIERGFFRHYLAQNPYPVKVWQDDGVLLGRTDFVQNNYHPIRISYWGNSVYITFFHGLGDGAAAKIFGSYLLCSYLALTGEDLDPDALYPVKDGETDNSYETYYRKIPFREGLGKTSGGNAAQIKGRFFVRDGLACTQGKIESAKVIEVAHKLGCTVGQLLAACALLAAVRTRAAVNAKHPPIVFVPVDLRRLYPSNSMFNFVGMLKCVIPLDTPMTVEAYVAEVRRQLLEQATAEGLQPTVSFTSFLSKNPVVKWFPLGLKMLFSKVGRALAKQTKQTIICSNLGKVDLPVLAVKHLEDWSFCVNVNRRTPQNFGVVSYGDMLSVTWTRHIVQNDVDVEFYKIMRELGLDMTVNSNYREVGYAL